MEVIEGNLKGGSNLLETPTWKSYFLPDQIVYAF